MKDWKYILYVAIAIGLFLVIKMTSPKQYDWTVTYDYQDKNPYGGYALNKLLPTIFQSRIEHSYQTLYEIKDSLARQGSLLIIATHFRCDASDTKALLHYVERGGTALISAQEFYGDLSDTLQLDTRDYYFLDHDYLSRKDTTYLRFVNAAFDTTKRFAFRKENIYNFFAQFDSTRTTVITRNDKGRPVTIKVKWGKGHLILNSTPMIFTNIYLLNADNYEFVSNILSYLPDDDLEWTEFYQVGRMESFTPLRYILRTEPLKWAYGLTMISLLIFMVFEMKRRQRIIPVIEPLRNTTLDFVSTIGNLYHQNREHKNIAEKKILFLFDYIRTRFYISTSKIDAEFLNAVSLKAGKNHEDVTQLFETIKKIRSVEQIESTDLIELNLQLEKFYQ
jgi:hypothetical protein